MSPVTIPCPCAPVKVRPSLSSNGHQHTPSVWLPTGQETGTKPGAPVSHQPANWVSSDKVGSRNASRLGGQYPTTILWWASAHPPTTAGLQELPLTSSCCQHHAGGLVMPAEVLRQVSPRQLPARHSARAARVTQDRAQPAQAGSSTISLPRVAELFLSQAQ